jgi:MOSC domain-containing protein YiiM
MKHEFEAKLVSLHSGNNKNMSKESHDSLAIELDGFPGDKHSGFVRDARSWDSEPTGTPRRNELQWSGVSSEELAIISKKMELSQPLDPGTLGANICLEGFPDFSQLPRGSKLIFPSGAVLLVERDNPPCAEMGERITEVFTTNSGEAAAGKFFSKYAIGLRGVVGVVDVAGMIQVGDRVVVRPFQAKSE